MAIFGRNEMLAVLGVILVIAVAQHLGSKSYKSDQLGPLQSWSNLNGPMDTVSDHQIVEANIYFQYFHSDMNAAHFLHTEITGRRSTKMLGVLFATRNTGKGRKYLEPRSRLLCADSRSFYRTFRYHSPILKWAQRLLQHVKKPPTLLQVCWGFIIHKIGLNRYVRVLLRIRLRFWVL